MWQTILVILALLVAAILTYAATRPKNFVVTRAADMTAAPGAIFPLIQNFHEWRRWSPYEDRDPVMKRTYAGPASGVGAIYEWQGNKNVGSGRMEILEAPAPRKIVIKLDFLKPFEAHNTAEFTFQPQGAGTRVTWAMRGVSPFMMRLMGIFMNMDEMIGKDFAAGLANLKRVVENETPAA